MTTPKPAVLFMDDEIDDPQARPVRSAIEALQAAGFEVTAVRTMSEAIDQFYARFYKVFVLDIDMSHVEDEFSHAKERGTMVAELYRALDNGTAVVMYSMMGLADDWLRLGNRHVYGYVFKGEDEAITRLVALVRRAANDDTLGLRLPSPRTSGRVVVCSHGNSRLDGPRLEALVREAGDFQVEFVPFGDMAAALQQPDVAAGLLVSDRFDARPSVLDRISAICGPQPAPQIVIACDGSDSNRPSILHIVNSRPFRLVNLTAGDAATAIRDAVRDAAHWYGGNEFFEAKSEYVHRAARKIDWDEIRRDLGSASEDDSIDTAGEDEA
jgi:DNA-binding response OmpR family regulator